MEDLNDKVTLGVLTAAEWNQVPSELQNIIEQTGQTLTNADLNQLGKGVADYVSNGNFYIDSGIADAYVLTTIGSKQSITEYQDGQTFSFIAGNTNIDNSTVNVNAIGVKNIIGTGISGVITATNEINIRYRAGSDDFVLLSVNTQVEDEGGLIVANPSAINFIGSGISVVNNSGTADVTVSRHVIGSFLTSDFVTTSDTNVAVTELNSLLSFLSGKHYVLTGVIRYSGDLSGIDFIFNDPSSTSLEISNSVMISDITSPISDTSSGVPCDFSYDDTDSPSADGTIRTEGFFLADSNGTLSASTSRNVSAGTLTIRAGTFFILTQLD